MTLFRTGLRIHEVPFEGWNYVASVQDVGRRDKTVPLSGVIRVDELQAWDAKVRETVLVSEILFEPAHPNDFDLLPSGVAGGPLRPSVVDENSEYVDHLAVLIRVGAVVVGGSSHYVRACAKVDDVRMPLEVICCVVDAKRLVNRNLAALADISIEYIFPGGFVILGE